jgi:hypothetical protein
MPAFLRRWTAKEHHESVLRQELLRVHSGFHTAENPHLIESTMYREHFSEREFLAFVLYDDEAALGSPTRQKLLAALDEVASKHAVRVTPPFRIETFFEYTAIPRTGAYGAAVMFRVRPDEIAQVKEPLSTLASEVVDRFSPSRLLLHHVIDDPGLFCVICDSEARIDLDRYLGSSLRREHRTAVGAVAIEVPNWFTLDPVWRYFRRQRT